jgi:hypothetical protein
VPVADGVYILCAATSLLCAGLLARGYVRSRMRLLLWSCLCFVGLAANNLLLVIDLSVIPGTDLSLWRTGCALAGMAVLLCGLIWDAR